jgi:hypothetical protein
MPPEAAPPANATPPAAVDDAAQAAADEQPLPPLDRDAEMKDQIARAKENVARDERKKARAEKKGSKGKAAPKAAPAPAPEVKVEPAATPEPEATEEEAPTRSLGSTVVEARKLFAAGDLDGALELVFGKKSDAFRVNSAKWAEWRKANATASRQMAEREQKLAHGVKAVEEKFGGFVAAKKAFDAGDYSGALKQAFGVDPETFNKKLLAQFHGKHPEVEALRNELRARDEAETKRQQEAREAREREQQQQLIARNLELLGEHLGRSEEAALSPARPTSSPAALRPGIANVDPARAGCRDGEARDRRGVRLRLPPPERIGESVPVRHNDREASNRNSLQSRSSRSEPARTSAFGRRTVPQVHQSAQAHGVTPDC